MLTCRIDDSLTLRLPEEADAGQLFELIDANRSHLRQWLPWVDGSTGPDKTLDFVRRSRMRFAKEEGFDLAIWSGGQIVGVVGAHGFDRANRSTSLGYWLAQEHGGKGIMTRSVQAVVGHLFERERLNRIVIHAATDNQRSRAIPERLKFKLEGVQRDAGWLYDHFVDLAIYSMLAREWASQVY